MYALYYKEFHIIKESITKNCTCQTYRNKQLAICNEREPLQEYIDKQKNKDRFFIEKMAF